MGVEQIMADTFAQARDYARDWAEWNAGRAPVAPRRNLRLEAALELLKGERVVHIHSYRQDEVLMFIRLAQREKLTVATFQHILEGYKVADEIAKIGAGGSCFSDWWAYKYEVVDAIPYDGAMMHAAGVVVSFNSDDSELARRMNTEAAKAVKYGGVPEDEALKFVTLNAAKQLRIDDRVGSIEVGKWADLVVWKPAFFGIKPAVILKGGFIAMAAMGDPNASIPTPQPVHYRPMFGAFGGAVAKGSLTFVSQAGLAAGIKDKFGL
eukprot:gene55997-76761_t